MMAEVVNFAPQPRMLRNGDQDESAGHNGAAHRSHGRNVVIQMFDHVERTRSVELRVERQTSGINLQKLDIRQFLLRKQQPVQLRFASDHPRAWKRMMNGGRDTASATSDFEHRAYVARVPLERPYD